MIRVKVCGLTRQEDARAAVEAGADYLGFIFAPSPRRLQPEAAARLVSGLAPGPQRVGVFVNESPGRIREIARTVGLTMVQLHGDEPPELCGELELPVIKVIRLDRGGSELERCLDRISPGIETHPAALLMIEPYVEGHYGGTGRRADWELARALVERFPARRFILAGGLSPENVGNAARTVRPFAVDASSGLETAPGVKSALLIRRFLQTAREATEEAAL